jgi:hypothetical protein
VTVEAILPRAALYVADFVERFSNVVAEERYEQTVRIGTMSVLPSQRRVLRSDLLIVKDDSIAGWGAFRDVFEVDGKPVRDRAERLTRLFEQPSAQGLTKARAIADESSRFNIGGFRTTNTPELAILFLQQSLQSRFTWTLGSRERSMGDGVWIVEGRERGTPTIVRSASNQNIPAACRFWIEADTGLVRQTELTLRQSGQLLLLTTIFKPDDRLRLTVPVEMRERYQVYSQEVTGRATYGSFRHFGVSTSEVLRGAQ